MTMRLPMIGKVQPSNPWLWGLVAAGLIGTGTTAALVARQSATIPDVAALTVPVESQALTVRITANGRVQPVQTVNISPKATGILRELLVEQGDRVREGQIIARMESEDVAARMMQARAQVAEAQARLAEVRSGNRPEEIAQRQAEVERARAQVRDAETRVQLANQRLERNRSLASQGAISRDALDEVVREANSARANLEQTQASLRAAEQSLNLSRNGSRAEDIAQAEAQLASALGNLRSVEVQQEDTVLRAPFDGIVTQKYATEGAFVTPTTSASDATSATSTAIVAIASGLEILADVPEVDIGQIRPGQTVEIRADALPNQVFTGEVRLVAPEAVVRQNVTSFQVRIRLLTGQDRLLSGMNVDLDFLGDRLDSAVVVPTVAIVTKDGQNGVLVPGERNRPEFRPVTLGTAVGNQTQILDGIEPGDRVFIDLPPQYAREWMQPQ
ncbi:efflux RND transporter periplasmic adaptor subunit [Thermoleptolyngbya sichuanensis A183]|uniref:Efflux RND transporter periplasmic adaptor subunit n=2 Tax=Oculatellaceae TaxID=2303507 RepID=A0A6M8B9H2_9CYAN|nr:efflux RND transporter periplasmic adaptor subunit [Thermoleptolyngbya sichuanensis A183]